MEESLIPYFLGELSEQEQIRLESEYLGDKEKFYLLKATRDELMDAYVGGKLSEKQCKQFEMHLLEFSGYRQNLDFAEVLANYMSMQEGANASSIVSVQ